MSYGVRQQPRIQGPLNTNQKLQEYLNSCPPELTELDLRGLQINSLAGIHFPPGLKHLYLSGNNITYPSIMGGIMSVVTGLEGINLLKLVGGPGPKGNEVVSPRQQETVGAVVKGAPRQQRESSTVFPPGLESLELRNNKIHSLEGIVFPPSLKFLDLEENQIKSLKGVVFPSGLEELHLNNNQINGLADARFPVGLKELDLYNNKIDNLFLVQFPPNLETLDLEENPLYEVDGMINPSKYVMEYLKRNFSTLYFHDLYDRHKSYKKDEKSALKAVKQSEQATLKEISDFTQQSMQNQLRGITSFLREGMEARAEQHAQQIKKAIEDKGILVIYIRLNGKIYPVPLNAVTYVQDVIDYMNQYYYVSSILPNCSVNYLYKIDGSHIENLEPGRTLADYKIHNEDILNIRCRTMQIGGKRIQGKKNKNKNKSNNRWSLKYKKSINCKRPRGFSQRQYCKYGRRTRKTTH
jgi:hypothetical protein